MSRLLGSMSLAACTTLLIILGTQHWAEGWYWKAALVAGSAIVGYLSANAVGGER